MDGLVHYLPASIFSFLHENDEKALTPPFRQSYNTVVLFADVSGYTALCEAMAAKGPTGDEYLAKHLNSYFELLVRTMASQGGDVFKFAGDAMIVLWPPSDEDIVTLTRRAAQCALEINRTLQDVKFEDGAITLAVKVGVGVGKISILHVGGVFGRAFAAEHHAVKKEVVVAPEAWALVKSFFKADIREDFAFLVDCINPVKKYSIMNFMKMTKNVKDVVLNNVKKYVPSAVTPYVSTHEEQWASELRRITVLFVNLGLNPRELSTAETQQDLDTVQKVLEAVQFAVYRYEGSLNKFLMDDKGSTLIAVFGLPPLAHEDDAIRGVLSALLICSKLHDLGKCPAIGITTGPAFCGVVGSRGRREYSVLGDTVNLSARLMQHASVLGGGVVVDPHTQFATRGRLSFEDLGKIAVKGKKNPVAIFHPYPKNIAHFFQKPKKKGDDDDHGHGKTQDGKELIVGRGQLKALSGLSDKAKAKLGLAPGNDKKEETKPEKESGPPKGLMESIHNSQLMTYAEKHFNAIKAGWAAKAAKKSASPQQRGSLTVAHGQHSLSITAGAAAAGSSSTGGISPALLAMASAGGGRSGSTLASDKKELDNVAWDNVGTKDTVTANTVMSKNDDGTDRKMKLRGVKITMPGGKGGLNMSLHKYSSVGALKTELWEMAKKRAMLDTSSEKKDDWLFQIPGKDLTLSDDMAVDLLSMFSASVFPSLNFIRSPNWNDSLDTIRSDIFKRIYTLADTKKGGLIMVDGDMGLGKTKLLLQVIDESPIPVYFGCGNPFEIARQLFSFRELFLQIVDTDIDTQGPLIYKEALPVNRRKCIIDKLKLKNATTLSVTYSAPDADKSAPKLTATVNLEQLAPVLNDLFQLEFPDSDITKGLDKDSRLLHCQTLLLALFQGFAAKAPIIIAFDDAIFMDKSSWTLVAKIVASVENTLIILATRPINKSYLAAFTGIPPEYTALVADKKTTTTHVLQPRPAELIHQAACQAVGQSVKEIPDSLSRLINDRAAGSPLVVKELVQALKKEGLITIGPSGVILGDELLKPKPSVQVPVILQCLLGCRLDKLSVVQQMILKTAAIIGEDFSYDFVAHTYPLALDNKDSSLAKEFQALVDLSYVKRLKKVGGGDIKEVMYTFTSGFMRDMLLSRMLKFQKKKLITKMEEVGNENLKRLDFASQFDRPESINGSLQMLKLNEENKQWETNYYSIRGDVLAYWATEEESHLEEKKQKPMGVIFLNAATIELYPAVSNALQINSKAWMRKGDYHRSAHSFKIQAKNADDCAKWQKALTEATANEREGKHYITDINSLSEAAKKDLQQSFDKTQTDHPAFKSIIMNEWLWSRKQVLQTGIFAQNWKKRWVTITDDFFALRKKEMKSSEPFVRPVQAASLTLPVPYQSALEFDKSKNVWTFTVSTPLWVKYDKVQWKMKHFILGHEKQEVAKRWADLIGKTLNRHRSPAAGGTGEGGSEIKSNLPKSMGGAGGSKLSKLEKMMGGAAGAAPASKPPAATAAHGTAAPKTPTTQHKSKDEEDEDEHLKKDTELFPEDDDGVDESKIPPPPPHPRTPSPPPPPPGSDHTDKVMAVANAHMSKHNAQNNGGHTPTSGTAPSTPSAASSSGGSGSRRGVLQLLDDTIAQIEHGSLRPEMIKQMLVGIKQRVQSRGGVAPSGSAPSAGANADYFPEDELNDPDAKQTHSDFSPPAIADMVAACDIDNTTKEWIAVTYTRNANPPAHAHTGADSHSDEHKLPENAEKLLASYLSMNVGHLMEWDWNIFAFEKDQLLSSIVQMFTHYNLFKTFAIPGDVFVNFIHAIRKNYFDVPFHNFYHAVDVMQTVFSLLSTFECDKILSTPAERFAILVSALCHDLRHPGLNNIYQVNARTPLALLYNDQSVLEQHHASSTYRILSDPKTNILCNVSNADYVSIRKNVVNGILATDMTCHFALIEKFNQVIESTAKKAKDAAAKPTAGTPTAAATASAAASPTAAAASAGVPVYNDAERALILNLVLHSADISNPCKPFNTSKRWSNLILEEFFQQGDIEKKEKLPVSPNCDRVTTEQSQLTLNFIDFIVAPIFVGLRNMVPKIHYICDILGHNRGQWTKHCDQLVESSKTTSEAQKVEERNRWSRRQQAFNTILVPKDGDVKAAQHVKDARAAEPRRASIAILDKFYTNGGSAGSVVSPNSSNSSSKPNSPAPSPSPSPASRNVAAPTPTAAGAANGSGSGKSLPPVPVPKPAASTPSPFGSFKA